LRLVVIDGEACFPRRERSRQADGHAANPPVAQMFDANRCSPRDRPIAKRAREILWPFGVANLLVVPG